MNGLRPRNMSLELHNLTVPNIYIYIYIYSQQKAPKNENLGQPPQIRTTYFLVIPLKFRIQYQIIRIRTKKQRP